MNPRENLAIRDAEGLLKEAEKRFPDSESFNLYQDAFDLLDDTSAIEVASVFANNLKLAYVRAIMENLDKVELKQFDVYFQFLVFLYSRAARERIALEESDAKARHAVSRSIDQFLPQLSEMIGAMQRRLQELKNNRISK